MRKQVKGKYQKRLQLLLQGLLFLVTFTFVLFLIWSSYSKQKRDWQDKQRQSVWYEQDSFGSRNQLLNTQVETLISDPIVRTFAKQREEYSYETIRMHERFGVYSTLFSPSSTKLYISSDFPQAKVISAEGTMTKEAFFKYGLHADDQLTEKIYTTLNDQIAYSTYFPIYNSNGDLREILRIDKRNSDGYSTILFWELLNSFFLQNPESTDFLLLKIDGQLFAASRKDLLEDENTFFLDDLFKRYQTNKDSTEPVIKIIGNKSSALCYKLPDSPFIIVALLPSAPISIQYYLMQGLIWASIFFLLSHLVSRKVGTALYKPVQAALEPISELQIESSNISIDELELIRQRVQNLRDMKNMDVYYRLLEGEDMQGLEQTDPYHALQMNVFVLGILESPIANKEDRDVFTKTLEKLKAEQNEIIVLREEGDFFTFLFLGTTVKIADEFLQRLLDRASVKRYAAISKIRKGAGALHLAQLECMELLDFRFQEKEGTVLHAENLPETRRNYYYYPIGSEQAMIKFIVDGKEDALGLFDKIIRENFEHRNISQKARVDLISAIVHTIRRAAQELKVDLNLISRIRHNSLEKIEEEREDPRTISELRLVLDGLVHYRDVQKLDDEERLCEKIRIYIDENYFYDIKLVDLADFLGFNEKYCSAKFATLFSTNFKEYLNQRRVDQAKRILRDNEEILISELAELVGFNSANSFIRVFKQFTGSTPAKFAKETQLKRRIN